MQKEPKKQNKKPPYGLEENTGEYFYSFGIGKPLLNKTQNHSNK